MFIHGPKMAGAGAVLSLDSAFISNTTVRYDRLSSLTAFDIQYPVM